MRILVFITAIMLPAALLLATGGKVTVSSAHATQKLQRTTPKPTPLPYFSTGAPVMCVENDRGYSWTALKVAQERQKGLITIEIETRKIDGTLITPTPTLPLITPTIQQPTETQAILNPN